MAWIKMRVELHDDPDVLSISNTLGAEPDLIVGKLHRFWSWIDTHCRIGKVLLVGNNVAQIREHVDTVCDQDGFTSALEKVNWIRLSDGEIRIPNWKRHLSQSAKKRALAAQRASRHRNAKVTLASRSEAGKRAPDKTRTEQIREDNTAAAAANGNDTGLREQKTALLRSLGVRKRMAEDLVNHENCTLEQIQIAAANAEHLRKCGGIKKSVPSYIRSAIIDDYEPIKGSTSWIDEEIKKNADDT